MALKGALLDADTGLVTVPHAISNATKHYLLSIHVFFTAHRMLIAQAGA